MRLIFVALPALLCAGAAAAQGERRPDPLDAKGKAPALEFRSAFDGYRPFTESELRDWRKANDAVRREPSKAAPGKPEAGHKGHGGHK